MLARKAKSRHKRMQSHFSKTLRCAVPNPYKVSSITISDGRSCRVGRFESLTKPTLAVSAETGTKEPGQLGQQGGWTTGSLLVHRVFWVVTPSSLASTYLRFGGKHGLLTRI